MAVILNQVLWQQVPDKLKIIFHSLPVATAVFNLNSLKQGVEIYKNINIPTKNCEQIHKQ